MRLLSTRLPIRNDVTKEEIYQTIIKWLKSEKPSMAVGEKFELSADKTSVRIVDGYCTVENIETEKESKRYIVFRLSHIYHEQTWNTDIIAEDIGTSKSIIIHVNCSGDTTLFDKVPLLRTEIIRTFIHAGLIKQGNLPIQTTPIYSDYGILDTLAGVINGTSTLPLPMVYVSKIFNSAGHEVNIENLAERLSGIAYVVAESSEDISFNLKDKTNAQNPFNGHIGIYYPNGGKAKKLSSYDARLWGALDVFILNDITKIVTAQMDKNTPNWEQFYADKLAADAKKSQDLIEDYINGYDSLEDKLKAAKEKISALTGEVTTLRNKNDSLQAALNATGMEEGIIIKSDVKEFFNGEQHDMLVTVLKEALDRSGGFDTRRYELIKSLLEQNEYIGNGRETLEVVKRVLSSGEAIGKREIQDLERVGFALINESTHYKFVYRGNERYWFSVSKTPSDKRSGKNSASDIIKRLSVYQ